MNNEEDDEFKIDGETLKRYFVQARIEKLCTCKNKQLKIDIRNREIECGTCGARLDPFDVVVELYKQESRYWQIMKSLRNQCEELEKWLLNNRMGSALREIARKIRQGNIPSCPHCKEPFDLEKIDCWWSREYAEAHFQQKLLNSVKEQQ